jgi:hypothetical protein
MGPRWKCGLSLAVAVSTAAALLVMFTRPSDCLWRRISGSPRQCLPGNPGRFDPYVDGKTLVARLCGSQFTEIRYLHASGYWVDGKLDSLAAGAVAKIVAARRDGQRCAIALSEGQATRSNVVEVYKSRWAWPECSTSDLWRHARASGFKIPEHVFLTFDYEDGVAFASVEGEPVKWTLRVGAPCEMSTKSFENSLGRWTSSHLATSIFESAQQGQQLLTTLSDAQRGCRSPDEVGCAKCCVPLLGACHVCRELSYLPGSYYCSRSSPSGPCSATCPRCAQCSAYDESKLRVAPSRSECDCRVLVVGDACFDLTSCDCYCQRLGPSLAACPGL